MRHRFAALHLLAGLTFAAALVACGSSGGGGGSGGGAGECPSAVDTTSADTFFETLACTHALKATNQSMPSDTTFKQGNTYDVVITADKKVKIPADTGEIAFDYANGGTYEDYAHEANAFLSGGGAQLIMQWDEADQSLLLVVTKGTASWKLDKNGGTGGNDTCAATDDPGGKACTGGDDCKIRCVCNNKSINQGVCLGTTCQGAAAGCDTICSGFGGWANMFCAAD